MLKWSKFNSYWRCAAKVRQRCSLNWKSMALNRLWGIGWGLCDWLQGRRMAWSKAWPFLGSCANSVNRRFINSRADSFCRHFTEAVYWRLEGDWEKRAGSSGTWETGILNRIRIHPDGDGLKPAPWQVPIGTIGNKFVIYLIIVVFRLL